MIELSKLILSILFSVLGYLLAHYRSDTLIDQRMKQTIGNILFKGGSFMKIDRALIQKLISKGQRKIINKACKLLVKDDVFDYAFYLECEKLVRETGKQVVNHRVVLGHITVECNEDRKEV